MEFLDFEQPLKEMEAKIEDLELFGKGAKKKNGLTELKKKRERIRGELYGKLTPWQTVKVARHPNRPYAMDYIENVFTDFQELHGDRFYADDPAIVAGFARFEGKAVCVIGHQKGRNTKQKIYRNFGMPRPEGYRKVLRIMKLAEKFKMPVFTLIDTPGAYPGLEAEERGQAEAIAVNLREMSLLRVPIIVTVTGEGGSGGALAIGVGDRINMLQHSIYSVISPEGCAAILWKDASRAEDAASALKLTAKDLKGLKLIDEIIEEPVGGVHVAPEELYPRLAENFSTQLEELTAMKEKELLEQRYLKFREMGKYLEGGKSQATGKGRKSEG